jgi:cytochrome c biogenesis protein CcdA
MTVFAILIAALLAGVSPCSLHVSEVIGGG